MFSEAGPVDGPSHLTTAEMLAPRAISPGGAAVNFHDDSAERETNPQDCDPIRG
jgi:hypothetical protein